MAQVIRAEADWKASAAASENGKLNKHFSAFKRREAPLGRAALRTLEVVWRDYGGNWTDVALIPYVFASRLPGLRHKRWLWASQGGNLIPAFPDNDQ